MSNVLQISIFLERIEQNHPKLVDLVHVRESVVSYFRTVIAVPEQIEVRVALQLLVTSRQQLK